MRHLKSTLAVLGAVTILVLAGNTIAMAATGKAFILGKANKAGTQTTLTRTTNGPVLKLNAKSGTGVPLAVRGNGKVANLNADKVDGFDSSALRTRSYVYNSTFSNKPAVQLTLPVPPGTYLVSYSNFFLGAGNAGIQCQVVQDNTSGADVITGYSSIVYVNDAWKPALTGTGIATKSATSQIAVRCNSSTGTFSASGFSPFNVIATPTTKVAAQTLTAQDPPNEFRVRNH